MTDFDFGEDDVAAMRRDGSLRELLRMQIADGAAKRDAKPKPVRHDVPGHLPGAWPAGCQPPSPPPPIPPAAWAAAVADYDRWFLAGSPQCQPRCECPACRPLDTEGVSDVPRS